MFQIRNIRCGKALISGRVTLERILMLKGRLEEFRSLEEAIVQQEDQDNVLTPSPELTPTRREAVTSLARRHPATIALIEEITAQVNAESQRRMDLAQAALRQAFLEGVSPFASVGIGALGAFATANLLLVTIALALGQVMAPWLAALMVSGVTFVAVSTVAIRTSQRRGWRIPFVHRFTVRKFVERLSVIS
jgi:hypothetical protein